MTKPVALVDLDGTLADYSGALHRDLTAIRSPEETGPLSYYAEEGPDPDWWRARTRMIRHQPGWWSGLGVLADGFEILEMLREAGFAPHVLTKGPSTTPTAWTEKVQWCQNELPGEPVTIASDKSMVYGRVLVDDFPDYVQPWLDMRPRGYVIMPDRPWNQGYSHPRCVRYVHMDKGTNREQLKDLLRLIANREDGQAL